MKHLKLLTLFILVSAFAYGQTSDNLPGSPITSKAIQIYKSTDGKTRAGSIASKFEVIANQRSLDSIKASISDSLDNRLKLTGGNITGVVNFNNYSSKQKLLEYPGGVDFLYTELADTLYGFNIDTEPGVQNAFFLRGMEGGKYQVMYFGDASDSTNVFGISTSEAPLSVPSNIWSPRFVVNHNGNVGVNKNNPKYDLDVAGIIHSDSLTSTGALKSVAGKIKNSTNVLIEDGGSSAITKLRVINEYNVYEELLPRGILSEEYGDSDHGAHITNRKARGTPSSPTAAINNDYIGGVTAEAYDGTNWKRVGYNTFIIRKTSPGFDTEWQAVTATNNIEIPRISILNDTVAIGLGRDTRVEIQGTLRTSKGFTWGSDSYTVGKIYKDPDHGTIISTNHGSSNDLLVTNGVGTPVIKIPTGTTKTILTGLLNVGSVSEYSDNAAALSGGLVVGDVYRTGDILKIVH